MRGMPQSLHNAHQLRGSADRPGRMTRHPDIGRPEADLPFPILRNFPEGRFRGVCRLPCSSAGRRLDLHASS